MDSSKTEETICCSPESGFGSEHQYSPPETAEDGTSSVAEDNVASVSKILFQPAIEQEDNSLSCLKIVDVKSLAVKSLGEASEEFHLTEEEFVETYPCPVKDAKRLCLQLIGNKKVLKLDTKLTSNVTENTSTSDLSSTSSISNDKKPICVSFSGLPVISNRHNFMLDSEKKDNFVLSLLPRDDRKRYKSLHTNRENQPMTSFSNIDATSFSKHRVIEHVDQKNISDKCYTSDPCISSKDLHSSGVSNCTDSVDTFSSSGFDKTLPLKPEKVDCKADRIRRLKEIILQKEKNLQTVRKNCGFIS